MGWLIGLIIGALIFAVIGNLLWRKANRLDPASEKNEFKFFVQNQLGAIISVLAFLPLVVLIFTNKNLRGKQKGIVGSIAVAALAIAGLTGTDLDPPSKEQYAGQTRQVEILNNGVNRVFIGQNRGRVIISIKIAPILILYGPKKFLRAK